MRSLVAGKWVDAKSGDVIKVINPATNELIDTVPSLSKEEKPLSCVGTIFTIDKVKMPSVLYTDSTNLTLGNPSVLIRKAI